MSNREFVEYRGVRMIAGWPERIQTAQRITQGTIGGVRIDRIRYGAERIEGLDSDVPCHDCRVLKGEFHVPSCDMEECPGCHGQLITCDCDYDDLET